MITLVKIGALEYLTAENIAVPHAFTTRAGGVSSGYLASMNLGAHRGDKPENVAQNYEILADALGFSTEKLVLTRQTHSDIVLSVSDLDACGTDHRAYPESDALITNTKGVALAVFTADCTPILLYDPESGAVGAAHAGWRGTASEIAAKTVKAMQTAFGCRPEQLCAAIGPNIGPCCFQTDADVPLAMQEAFGAAAKAHIIQKDEKYYVNLKALNALSLRRAGVANIAVSAECTFCNPDRFWSHRYHGAQRGSQGAIIVCKEANR